MENNKKTVVYVRTTSTNQNLDIQLEAAKPFLKGIQEDNVIYIVDQGVRASSERNGLQQLLDLISQDKVATLIVYQRDRLTRSEDQYQSILNLIYAHGVKIVFQQKTPYLSKMIKRVTCCLKASSYS